MNGGNGDRVRAGITGAFALPLENEKGRGLCVGNINFEHKSLHNYTRVAKGHDVVELKIIIDLVLVKKDMLRSTCCIV